MLFCKCVAEKRHTGQILQSSDQCRMLLSWRRAGGTWDLTAFLSLRLHNSFSLLLTHWSYIPKSCSLTPSLLLNIAPEKQVWYKLCLGFVITKVMVFGIRNSDLASLFFSASQCPLFSLGNSLKFFKALSNPYFLLLFCLSLDI